MDASRLELEDECKEKSLLLCPELPHAVPIFPLSRITPYYPSILDNFAASYIIITPHSLFQCNQPLCIPSHFSLSSFQHRCIKRAGQKYSI